MRIKILLLVLPFFAFASEHGGVNYDITERALNFLLFFGILLYFVAKPLKDLYQSGQTREHPRKASRFKTQKRRCFKTCRRGEAKCEQSSRNS